MQTRNRTDTTTGDTDTTQRATADRERPTDTAQNAQDTAATERPTTATQTDTVKEMKTWLSRYNDWKFVTDSAAREIRELLQEVDAAPALRAVRYDSVPGSRGGCPSSIEEKLLERKQALLQRVARLQEHSRAARENIALMENALACLDQWKQDVVRYRGIEGMPWPIVAARCGYKVSRCKYVYNSLLMELKAVRERLEKRKRHGVYNYTRGRGYTL